MATDSSFPAAGTDWTAEDWNRVYKSTPEAPWASTEVDKRLLKYEDRLLVAGRQHKIFFPLCGEVLDMKWAYDKGHEVVGLDCINDGLRKFFETHGIPYTETKMDEIKGTLFKSNDGRIRLYGCSIEDFKSDMEKNCTAIFDSAAITALNKSLIPGYCQLMKEMMSDDARYIMYTMEFDESKFPGPPHNLPIDLIKTYMGDGFSYEHLETADMMKEFMDEGPGQGEGHKGSEGEEFIQEHLDSMSNLDHMWGHYTLISKR